MKKLKIIGIVFVTIVICYVLYVGIELIRFNNNFGVYPLINLGAIDIDVNVESNLQKKRIYGIGYIIEYEYIKQQEEDSDIRLNKIISGKFKLFNEFLLSSWIE